MQSEVHSRPARPGPASDWCCHVSLRAGAGNGNTPFLTSHWHKKGESFREFSFPNINFRLYTKRHHSENFPTSTVMRDEIGPSPFPLNTRFAETFLATNDGFMAIV